jgi:hypothetical protein
MDQKGYLQGEDDKDGKEGRKGGRERKREEPLYNLWIAAFASRNHLTVTETVNVSSKHSCYVVNDVL